MFWHKALQVLLVSILLIGVIILPSAAEKDPNFPASVTAESWYVQPDGNNSNNCLSPGSTNACKTIQAAVDKASPGDTINVATGIYTAASVSDYVVVVEKENISLLGGWNDDFSTQIGMSIIDGEKIRGGIRIGRFQAPGTGAAVDRFIIQNGYKYGGGGIAINQSDTIISNSIIRDNMSIDPDLGYADVGGGIANYNSDLTLTNVSIINNGGSWGGGIYTVVRNGESIVILNGSSIIGNKAIDQGGGVYNEGTLILNNSTISGNTAYYRGGGIFNQGGTNLVIINNSTVVHNSAAEGGGIYHAGYDVVLQNSILANNSGDTGPDCSGNIHTDGFNILGDTSGCSFTPSTGDIIGVDPNLGLLIGSPAYHPLYDGSLAIDAGNPAGCTDHLGNPLSTDQRGASRVNECDIGAYEYTSPGPASSISVYSGSPQRTAPLMQFRLPIQAVVMDAIGTPVENTTVTFSAPSSGASGIFTSNEGILSTVLSDQDGIADVGKFKANQISGSYSITAQVTGIPTANFLLTNTAWYVTPSGNDQNECSTPGSPCLTVKAVQEKSGFVEGDAILMSEGTYTGFSEEVIQINKDVKLLGGWNVSFTSQNGTSVVDGESLIRGITISPNTSVAIANVTVQNGFAEKGGGIYNEGSLELNHIVIRDNNSSEGGGITHNPVSALIGDLFVRNTTIEDNTSTGWGGGILILGTHYSIVRIENSTVYRNTASGGGGIYLNSGNLELTNSTVSGNLAGNDGGGINNDGTLSTINSSTIYNNSAGQGGGIYDYHGDLAIQNTILSENSAVFRGPDCYTEGGFDSEGYNLIGDTTYCSFSSGTGDMFNVDPRVFTYLTGSPGYQPLLPSSPAIDAGNPSGCTDHLGNLLLSDQRGTTRPLDGDSDGSPICDIGAYEFDSDHPTGEVFLASLFKNYCPDFFDDFSNPTSGWFVGDDGYHLVDYFNQEYRVLTKQSDYIYLFRAPNCARESYVVEADMRWNGEDYGYGYGLLFGLNGDYSHYYYFEVLALENGYRLWRRDSSGFMQLAWFSHWAINGGSGVNHLKITRVGDQITLNVNGTDLGTWTDGVITGLTYTGVATRPYLDKPVSDLRVDNFSVEYLSVSSASSLHINNTGHPLFEKDHFIEIINDFER